MAKWFPGLRGLAGKSLVDGLEEKTVYSANGSVLENSGRFGLSSSKPQGGEWTIDRALAEGFRREPYVYKAVDTIAEKSSSLVFKLHDGDGNEVERHPLLGLMNDGDANPLETGHQFRYRLSLQLLLSPRGAFVNVVKSRGGDVVSLALLPPDRTSPVPNESDPSKLISGFKVDPKDGTSKPTFLSVEEVRWIRKPHPVNPFLGMTPLEAAGLSVQLSYFARLFNVSFMRNDGRPGGILGVESDMTDAEMDRIEAKFGRGPMEAGKLTVMGGKISYSDTGQAPRDMAYQELAGNSRNEILSSFGVPESQIGHASDSTFSNADAEGYAFWTHTMSGHNRMILSAFGKDIDDGLKASFDTSEIEELQEPVRKKREEARSEFDAGLRSLFSYGELANIEVPDIPETRAFYVKVGTTPIPGRDEDVDYFKQSTTDSSGGQELDDSTGQTSTTDSSGTGTGGGSYTSTGGTDSSGGSGQAQGTPTVAARRVTPTQPQAPSRPVVDAPQARSGTSVEPVDGKALEGKGEAVDAAEQSSDSPVKLLDATEDALNKAADLVVTRQANVVVERLKSPRFKKGTKHWVVDESKPLPEYSVKALDGDALVQGDRWADVLADSLTPIVTDACQSAAEGIIDDLGLDDIESKARHRKLNDKQAKVVAETAADALFVAKSAMKKHSVALAARIKEADAAGKDLDGIIADVQAYAEQYRRGWSKAVMQQVGQVAIEQTRLRVSDLSKNQRDIARVWVSRKDDKVRPTHKAADGERKRLGQPFKVGSASIRFPGDPLGPPSEVIGCRCRTVFRSKATGRAVKTPAGEVTSAPERKALELVWSVA